MRYDVLGWIAGLAVGWSAPAALSQEYQLTFGHVLTEDTPNHKAALAFAEEVDEKSDGRISVQVLPAAQLGGDVEIIEQLQAGLVDIAIPPTATLGNFEPKMQMLDLPYLLPNREKMVEVLDGDAGRQILDLLEPHGMHGAAFWGAGFRHMTTAGTATDSPEKLSGVKMRTMQSPIIIEQYRTWDANPTAMAFTEVYNALQQGVVDGQENPLANIYSMKFFEVQDYLTMTGHAYHGYAAVVNKNTWDSMPEDLQNIMQTAFENSRDLARDLTVEWETEILEEIKDEIEVVELTDEEKAAYIEASKPIHEEFRALMNPEILDAIYEITGTFQQ